MAFESLLKRELDLYYQQKRRKNEAKANAAKAKLYSDENFVSALNAYRSENFEYYAAKKANRENNGRINYLERVLRFARIIDDSSKDDEVGLNNTVTLYFEEDDEEETYRIVTSIRGNSIHGLISNESPIGRAIMGHKVGDRCTVRMENGISYDVIIRNIENTGESADDQIKAY